MQHATDNALRKLSTGSGELVDAWRTSKMNRVFREYAMGWLRVVCALKDCGCQSDEEPGDVSALTDDREAERQ